MSTITTLSVYGNNSTYNGTAPADSNRIMTGRDETIIWTCEILKIIFALGAVMATMAVKKLTPPPTLSDVPADQPQAAMAIQAATSAQKTTRQRNRNLVILTSISHTLSLLFAIASMAEQSLITPCSDRSSFCGLVTAAGSSSIALQIGQMGTSAFQIRQKNAPAKQPRVNRAEQELLLGNIGDIETAAVRRLNTTDVSWWHRAGKAGKAGMFHLTVAGQIAASILVLTLLSQSHSS